MSDKLPKQQPTQELDLGHLFSYIENLFKNIGAFIKKLIEIVLSIIKKLGILILLLFSTAKKHFLKIAAVGLITFTAFHFLDKYSTPVYESKIVVKQNFDTGKILYNTIYRLDKLAKSKDTLGLVKELKIPENIASKITGFGIYDNMNKYEFRESYYNYLNETDSLDVIPFSDFRDYFDLERYDIQSIAILSEDPTVYQFIKEPLLNIFETNEFFQERKRISIELLENKIKALEQTLSKSDTLQNQYIQLLNKYYGQDSNAEQPNTTLNLNLSNSKDRISTKEYELFNVQSKIRLELVELNYELQQKTKVLNIQKDFSTAIPVESVFKEKKILATIIMTILSLLFFLNREFKLTSVIGEYATKEKLFENK